MYRLGTDSPGEIGGGVHVPAPTVKYTGLCGVDVAFVLHGTRQLSIVSPWLAHAADASIRRRTGWRYRLLPSYFDCLLLWQLHDSEKKQYLNRTSVTRPRVIVSSPILASTVHIYHRHLLLLLLLLYWQQDTDRRCIRSVGRCWSCSWSWTLTSRDRVRPPAVQTGHVLVSVAWRNEPELPHWRSSPCCHQSPPDCWVPADK